jgi:hypothetical protein
MIMAKAKDPEDVVASIRRSIEVSSKGSRRVRCHTLRDLFGFDAWTGQRKERVGALLDDQGIHAQPSVTEAGLHDWIVLSLPVMPRPDDSSPDPRPSREWFEHLRSIHLDSEREVEMFFASPLFHALGYDDEQEAAGFRFDMWEGVTRRKVEADLIYFVDGRRSLEDGCPWSWWRSRVLTSLLTRGRVRRGVTRCGLCPRTMLRRTATLLSSTTFRAP